MKRAAKKPAHADAWEKLLTRHKNREKEVVIDSSFHNAALIVSHDLAGTFGWDEFRSCVVLRSVLPSVAGFESQGLAQVEGQPLTDTDVKLVDAYLAREWRLDLSHTTVASAITMAAKGASFHPVTEWLVTLRWDKTPRIDTWLIDFCGVEDTPYSRKVAAWFLCGAVGRVCTPGVKHDEMLVLEGLQGRGKSKAFRALAGEWFSDSPLEMGSKDRFIQLRGNWIVEIAELDGFTKAEVTKVKAYMSSSVDDYRPPFAMTNIKAPRQCVFAGTVNENEYLHDATGGRRFYPVKVTKQIDHEGIAMVREQLWAEALERWSADSSWRFQSADYEAAKVEQEARRKVDPWEPGIDKWASEASGHVTIQRILFEHLGLSRDRWGRVEETRVGKCLTALGWIPKQIRVQGVRVRVYCRVDPGTDPGVSQPSQPVTTCADSARCDSSEACSEAFG